MKELKCEKQDDDARENIIFHRRVAPCRDEMAASSPDDIEYGFVINETLNVYQISK